MLTCAFSENLMGDVCEGDADGDGYQDNVDNCPRSTQYHNATWKGGISTDLQDGGTPEWQLTHVVSNISI